MSERIRNRVLTRLDGSGIPLNGIFTAEIGWFPLIALLALGRKAQTTSRGNRERAALSARKGLNDAGTSLKKGFIFELLLSLYLHLAPDCILNGQLEQTRLDGFEQ